MIKYPVAERIASCFNIFKSKQLIQISEKLIYISMLLSCGRIIVSAGIV